MLGICKRHPLSDGQIGLVEAIITSGLANKFLQRQLTSNIMPRAMHTEFGHQHSMGRLSGFCCFLMLVDVTSTIVKLSCQILVCINAPQSNQNVTFFDYRIGIYENSSCPRNYFWRTEPVKSCNVASDKVRPPSALKLSFHLPLIRKSSDLKRGNPMQFRYSMGG